MLAYQSYNVKSPLNGEAARWVEENKHRVPLDRVSLLPEEERQSNAPQPAKTPSAKATALSRASPFAFGGRGADGRADSRELSAVLRIVQGFRVVRGPHGSMQMR